MTSVLQRYSHDDQRVLCTDLLPLARLHFDNSHSDTLFAHGNAQVVTIFSVLGIRILLVACIIYVNLTTVPAGCRRGHADPGICLVVIESREEPESRVAACRPGGIKIKL